MDPVVCPFHGAEIVGFVLGCYIHGIAFRETWIPFREVYRSVDDVQYLRSS